MNNLILKEKCDILKENIVLIFALIITRENFFIIKFSNLR